MVANVPAAFELSELNAVSWNPNVEIPDSAYVIVTVYVESNKYPVEGILLPILTRFHLLPLVTSEVPEWQLVQLFSFGAPVYPELGPEELEMTFPTKKMAKEAKKIFIQRIFKFRNFSYSHDVNYHFRE